MPQFSQDFDMISKKKKKKRSSVFHIMISHCHFLRPSAGPPEAHGPPKVHGPRGHFPPDPPLVGPGKMLCCLDAMTRRWASPTCSMPRRNTASMKDLIYHISVVFFQCIILIVLTGGTEFTVWKKGTHYVIKLETNSLSFFLMVCLF